MSQIISSETNRPMNSEKYRLYRPFGQKGNSQQTIELLNLSIHMEFFGETKEKLDRRCMATMHSMIHNIWYVQHAVATLSDGYGGEKKTAHERCEPSALGIAYFLALLFFVFVGVVQQKRVDFVRAKYF